MATYKRILMIEDDPDDEVLLLRQLRKTQFERHIEVIRDGGEAIEYLTNEGLDPQNLAAVFLDLRLPRVGGLQILEAIRSDSRFRTLPVIVMTSSNSLEELARCRELGVSCYVQKPITFASFAEAFTEAFQAADVA